MTDRTSLDLGEALADQVRAYDELLASHEMLFAALEVLLAQPRRFCGGELWQARDAIQHSRNFHSHLKTNYPTKPR